MIITSMFLICVTSCREMLSDATTQQSQPTFHVCLVNIDCRIKSHTKWHCWNFMQCDDMGRVCRVWISLSPPPYTHTHTHTHTQHTPCCSHYISYRYPPCNMHYYAFIQHVAVTPGSLDKHRRCYTAPNITSEVSNSMHFSQEIHIRRWRVAWKLSGKR